MTDDRPIDMMIVGVQKAGTSSLKRYLGEHPQVCTHLAGEMTFFLFEDEYRKGYRAACRRYFAQCRPEQARVAKNVGVIYVPEAVERLYEHNPDAHVVVMLRNPVDRAYSAYWFCRRRGWENLRSFEEAVEAEEGRLQAGGQRARHLAYLDRGKYAPQLIRLLDRFERDRVHVFLMEDLKTEPQRLCARLFTALGVSTEFTPTTGRRYNEAAVARSNRLARLLIERNPVKTALRELLPPSFSARLRRLALRVNEREFTPPPLDPETRARLVEYFEPYNRELSELLERDLSPWNR